MNCKHCSKKFKKKINLEKHEKTHCNDDETTSNKTCNVCGLTFKYKTILERHLLIHTSNTNSFFCPTCYKSFETQKDMELHTQSHKVKKKFKCKICTSTSFLSEEEYLYHVKMIHKGKFIDLYMCSDCGKQFKTKNELTIHIKSKCGTIKQYNCKVCNKELMTAGSLHNHMLRHNGEPTFMCRFCAKLFITAGQLKVHERIHTQEKAFICNICGKGFCHRQSLITHSTLHTGVKPYLCENCGNSFSCVGNLLKHRKTHSDTCGLIPLVTHRVKHPSTKIKVKVNTPKNSKLKAYLAEKELQEKLSKATETLENRSTEAENVSNEECTMDETNLLDIKIEEVVEDIPILSSPLSPEISENNIEILQPKIVVEEFLDNEWKVSEVHLSRNVEQKVKHLDKNMEKIHQTEHRDDKDMQKTNDNQLSNDSTSSDNKLNVKSAINTVQKTRKKEQDSDAIKMIRAWKVSDSELNAFLILRNIKNKSDVPCMHCKKKYNNVKWLMKHEKIHSTKMIEKNTGTIKRQIRDNNTCRYCKDSFPSKELLKKHQEKKHADILTCEECDKLFSNVDSLKIHENVAHKGVARKVYTYVCEKCGKLFKRKFDLESHEKSQCGPGFAYTCEICKKNFSGEHVRKAHMRIHDPEKKLLCKFCGKSFHWKGQMLIHERSHTGEKPFTCLYCPKAFAYRESLITHSSLHTGIKSHLCEACGSRFSCIGNLIKHKVTHATTCGIWYKKNEKVKMKSEKIEEDCTIDSIV